MPLPASHAVLIMHALSWPLLPGGHSPLSQVSGSQAWPLLPGGHSSPSQVSGSEACDQNTGCYSK
eukprot:1140757-Pelagomonas_calceolata.AAC.1